MWHTWDGKQWKGTKTWKRKPKFRKIFNTWQEDRQGAETVGFEGLSEPRGRMKIVWEAAGEINYVKERVGGAQERKDERGVGGWILKKTRSRKADCVKDKRRRAWTEMEGCCWQSESISLTESWLGFLQTCLGSPGRTSEFLMVKAWGWAWRWG